MNKKIINSPNLQPSSSNSIMRLENSDVMNLFNNFVDNFMQNVGTQQRNNIFYEKRNDFNIFNSNQGNTRTFEIKSFSNQNYYPNNMIENGPNPARSKPQIRQFTNIGSNNVQNMTNMGNMSPVAGYRDYDHMRKRDRKRLRSPSPVGMEEWKRVTELSYNKDVSNHHILKFSYICNF